MSERIKAYIYIRVKDAEAVLNNNDQAGTVAVAVDGFSDDWKLRADDRYAAQFGLSNDDLTRLRHQIEIEKMKPQPNEAMVEEWEQESLSMETARNMLLEQDYQWPAEIDMGETYPAEFLYFSASTPTTPYLLTEAGHDNPTPNPVWEGSFIIITIERSAKEMVEEHLAQGKTVLCAVPLAMGSRALVLGSKGHFSAFEILPGELKVYDKNESYKFFAELRGQLQKDADTDEQREIAG